MGVEIVIFFAKTMTDIKLLTKHQLNEFTSLLEEINEGPLGIEVVRRLGEDFALGRYIGFLLYNEGALAGMAATLETYSVVHARKILNLDELYVRSQSRGKGLGKRLFDRVVEYARASGYMRLEWRAEKNNTAAGHLYAQYETDTNWTYYVMKL